MHPVYLLLYHALLRSATASTEKHHSGDDDACDDDNRSSDIYCHNYRLVVTHHPHHQRTITHYFHHTLFRSASASDYEYSNDTNPNDLTNLSFTDDEQEEPQAVQNNCETQPCVCKKRRKQLDRLEDKSWYQVPTFANRNSTLGE